MDDPLISFAITIIGPAVLCIGGLLLAIGVTTLVGAGVKKWRSRK